jgi:HD-GYP domain-containing protein (c-di-GMP phosphodiesterase class II)
VTVISRMLLAATVSLAFPVSAQAANDDAPGELKKQVTTPVQAAPAPTPTSAPAPAPAPRATTKTSPTVATKPAAAKAPTTSGTTRTIAPTQPATPSSGSATSAARAVRRSASRRAAVRRAAASERGAERRRGAARSARSHGVPVRAHGKAGAPGQKIAANARLSAPGQLVRQSATQNVAARKAAAKAEADRDDDAPLATISRAADRVIEVIPGAVILGMAALATMVLLLILRSLAVERQRGRALATSYGVTVEALATAIEAKDHTTGGHIERVRRLGLLLAEEIVPREANDPQMAYGFLLHDIGKLAVPDAILRAPGRLSEEQWALMRRHPEEGVRMLSHVPFLDKALDVVRDHHERWDGGGYPAGLRGEDIPLWARIFAVVDALDAMTAERPYRAARSYTDALEEIRRHSGTQFDPAVVEALEHLDRSVVEPLLEPTQLVEPLAELPKVQSLAAV